jgi:cell division protein FtsL
MLYTIIWITLLALLGFVIYKSTHTRDSYSDWPIGVFLCGFLVVAFLVACIIISGVASGANISARNTGYVIAERVEQRDKFAVQIRDELSAEKYSELLEALPDDVNLRVWLGDGASSVLRDRAERILALNKEIYDLELSVTTQRKNACDMVQNPWVPRLPFNLGFPDCELLRRDT